MRRKYSCRVQILLAIRFDMGSGAVWFALLAPVMIDDAADHVTCCSVGFVQKLVTRGIGYGYVKHRYRPPPGVI